MQKIIHTIIASSILISSYAAGNIGECSSSTDAMNMMTASQAPVNTLRQNYFKKQKMYDKAYEIYQQHKLQDAKKLEKINELAHDAALASEKWSQYVKEISSVGKIIVQKKYQEACDTYIHIAKKYGFDITTLKPNALTTLMNKLKNTKVTKKSTKPNNNKCSVNDAIALYYKEHDIHDMFSALQKKWHNKERIVSHAKLYNASLRKILIDKGEEVEAAYKTFFSTFKETVKIHITDDKLYDMACDNYTKLEKEYMQVLKNLEKEYETFDPKAKKSHISKKSTTTPSKKIPDNNMTYDGFANKKYNAMVNAVNHFSPKIRTSFKTYAMSCGADKTKRQKTLYTKVNGYNVHVYYDGTYEEGMLNALKDSLLVHRLSFANDSIKAYLDRARTFMKLFSTAAEYYEMKDYTEDNFKQADAMHTKIVTAFQTFINSDLTIRKVIEEISDEQTRKRIEAYKANNQMMFYFVEKSQYLAKHFLAYASTDEYVKLDTNKTKKLHQTMRAHYQEFKAFKQKNETVFKDNGAYTSYLSDFRDYISESKNFYLSVKNKKSYANGEASIMKYLPPQARAAIAQNTEGTIQKLLNSYNTLVNEYNHLNR